MSEYLALILSIVALAFSIWTTYESWKLQKQLRVQQYVGEITDTQIRKIQDSLGDD